jgi:predicted nucleic acid-binding protein
VQNAIRAGWMKVEHAELAGDAELEELDPGEAEAIALAQKLGALLIIDEAAGREVALHRNVRVTGTLGILLEAKQRGLTSNLAQEIERLLRSTTFRLAVEVRDEFLRQAGESPP